MKSFAPVEIRSDIIEPSKVEDRIEFTKAAQYVETNLIGLTKIQFLQVSQLADL